MICNVNDRANELCYKQPSNGSVDGIRSTMLSVHRLLYGPAASTLSVLVYRVQIGGRPTIEAVPDGSQFNVQSGH